MSINDNFGRNRARYRKVYAYGLNRRPEVRQFIDLTTNTTRSLDFQKIIRDRSYYLINGQEVLTFPSGSTVIIQYEEDAYQTSYPIDYIDVVFSSSFNEIPFVAMVLTPESTLSGSNVAYWATDITTTGFKANFSAPFDGRLLYRAVYTDGTYPVYVDRGGGKFAWIAGALQNYNGDSSITMSFDNLPGNPNVILSNPIGLSTDPTLNIAQTFQLSGSNFATYDISAPFSGSFNVVAMESV